jgi:hypothetical protein
MRNGYKFLVGNPEGKRLLVRYRRGREDNIRMDRKEMALENRVQRWTVMNTVLNFRVEQNVRHVLTSLSNS